MTDEMNQAEPGGQSPSEREGLAVPEEVTELKRVLARRDEELSRANARLVELEQALAGRDGQIDVLNQTRAELEERLTTLDDSLTAAVASYKAMVVQANPELIEELISGDSIESINESLGKARTLVSKVRQGVEAAISLAKVPAGAPERMLPDFSSLSPQEKIKYAIGGKR